MIDDSPILRPAARVLLIDEQDQVLLLRANVDEGDVRITPGGAPEPGETPEQAALRELREETGIEGVELSQCVWTRVHRFEWAESATSSRSGSLSREWRRPTSASTAVEKPSGTS